MPNWWNFANGPAEGSDTGAPAYQGTTLQDLIGLGAYWQQQQSPNNDYGSIATPAINYVPPIDPYAGAEQAFNPAPVPQSVPVPGMLSERDTNNAVSSTPNPAPPGGLAGILGNIISPWVHAASGAAPPVGQAIGAGTSQIAPAIQAGKDAASYIANTHAGNLPQFSSTGVTMHPATFGDVWTAAGAPSEYVGENIPKVIPGPAGEILGAAGRELLRPENVIGAAVGGPGIWANLLGRGEMTAADYAAMLAFYGGSKETARQLGAPPIVQEAIGLGGAVFGPGGVRALGPEADRALSRVLETLTPQNPGGSQFFSGIGDGGSLERQIKEQVARDAARSIPDDAVVQQLRSRLESAGSRAGLQQQIDELKAGGVLRPDYELPRYDARQSPRSLADDVLGNIYEPPAAGGAIPPGGGPPVEPPSGGGLPPGGGGEFSGKPIDYSGVKFGPTEPLLGPGSIDPLFGGPPLTAPPIYGPNPARELGPRAPTPEEIRQAALSGNKTALGLAPGGAGVAPPPLAHEAVPSSQGAFPNMLPGVPDRDIAALAPGAIKPEVEQFVHIVRNDLQRLPLEADLKRKVQSVIEWNLESPFLDGQVAAEKRLRELVVPGLDSLPDLSKVPDAELTALADKMGVKLDRSMARDDILELTNTAVRQKAVDDTTAAFRAQMLDERYGAHTQARANAEAVLKANDKERIASGAASRYYDVVSDTLKETLTGLDVLGAVGQQGGRVIRNSPAVFTGLVSNLMRKIGVDPLKSFYAEGVDRGAQRLAHGVELGKKGTTAGIGNRSVLERIPVAGPLLQGASTFQFERALGGARSTAFDGLLLINKALGQDISDPKVIARIREGANMIGSSARAPTTARGASIAQRGLFTGPMTRAMINETLTPLKTLRSVPDFVNTANLVLGTALLFGGMSVVNDQFGVTSLVTDPGDSMFGKIISKYKDANGKNRIFDFLPQAGLFRTIIKTSNDPANAAKIWGQWGSSRLNVIPGDMLKSAGVGFDSNGQFRTDLSWGERGKGIIPVPLGFNSFARGDFTPGSLIAGQTGVSTYGESNYNTFERAFKDAVGKPLTDFLPGEIDALALKNPALQAEQQRYQDNREGRSAELTRAKYEALDKAAPLLATDPVAYREQVGDVVKEAAIRYDEAKKNGEIPDYAGAKGIRGVLDGYYEAIKPARSDDTIGATVDYDLQEKLGAEYLSKLEPDVRDRIVNELSYSRDETYRGLLEARRQLAPYFDIVDQSWAEAQKQNPKLADFKSPDAYITEQQQRLMDRGLSRDDAKSTATELAGIYMATAQDKQEIYLLRNQPLLKQLYKYGYYVPADLKDLAALPGR